MKKAAFVCPLISMLMVSTLCLQAKPNILFIYTDDQAPWALGAAVEMGLFDEVPAAHTPHLDRLASEGPCWPIIFVPLRFAVRPAPPS
jgi:hypothetical protein